MKALSKLTTVLAVLLLAVMVAGIDAKMKDLDFPPLNKIEVPQPQKFTLDNGMTVYLLEDHSLPRINVSVRINRCGSYLEPAELIGLAGMTGEVMRTGGTTSMPGDEIDEQLEAVGAYVETGIGTTSGSAGANGLSEYADLIIGTLADVLRNPVFAEEKVELARSNIKSGISRRNDEPMDITLREFRKLIFGSDSPYARHAEYATIDAISRDDLIMFHKMTVMPNSIQIAVWGDFTGDEMLALIRDKFGSWAKGQIPPEPPDVDYEHIATVNYAPKTDVTQSQILLGHVGGKMGDPDYPAAIVMNSILGGGFGSRLFNNVRSKKGYAYAASGQFSFNYDYPGWFYAYSATKSESTVDAILEIKKQIESMQTDPPTEMEMTQAKEGWLNSYVFNFDTRGEVLGRMMTYDYYGMPQDYLQQLKEEVESVTPEDVMEVAKKKLHPDALQILVVGNKEDFGKPLSEFGEVNEIDITIPEPEAADFAATEEELATGMKMLAKTVETCGGVDNFKKINNVKTAAAVTMAMPQGSMTINIESITMYPTMSYQLVKTPMGNQESTYIGDAGWVKAQEQVQMMGPDELEESKTEMKRDMVMVFAAVNKPYYQVAYRGEQDFGGQTAARLDFFIEPDIQWTMYIDPATSMPVGKTYMGQTMAGPGEIVSTYSEWKEFAGTKHPVKTNRDMGPMTMDVEVTSMTVNGKIDESIFTKPEGI